MGRSRVEGWEVKGADVMESDGDWCRGECPGPEQMRVMQPGKDGWPGWWL